MTSATPPSPRWCWRSKRARPSTWPPSLPDVGLHAAPDQRHRRRDHLCAGGSRLHDGLRGPEAHQLRPRRRDDGGTFVGYAVAQKLGRPAQSTLWGVLLIFLVAMVACALLGWFIERFAYRPLRDKPRLTALITAIGISFTL